MSNLLLVLALVSGYTDRCRDRGLSRSRTCDAYAFFEFAPASGVGMTSVCGCTNPTGVKGEALTLTRASSAFCTKGHVMSGIVNGDLVSCGNNLARVMPGGDGTGVLGLLLESAATNVALRSAELDNAVWVPTGVGVAAPTITADNTTAPDNNVAAEKLDFTATTAGQESSIVQPVGGAGFVGSTSLYIKGVSGSGTIDICTYTGAANVCTACSYVSASWTRCSQVAATLGAASSLSLGNLTRINGGTNRSANSVYMWGVQTEAVRQVTSYVATTGSSATRAGESSSFSLSLTNASGSIAVTGVPDTSFMSNNTNHYLFSLNHSGLERVALVWKTDVASLNLYSHAGVISKFYSQLTAYTEHRFSGNWLGGDGEIIRDGSSGTGTFTAPTASIAANVGTHATLLIYEANLVVKKVCVDPSQARCR